MNIKITGGLIYDPARGRDGAEQDLLIAGDRIVARLPHPDLVIQARGQILAPAGIELRGQVASYGLNFLHLWNPSPTLSELGGLYAAMGYTHVHEPFLTLYTAGYVHRQLAALPLVDTSASLALNLRDLDQSLKSPGDMEELVQTVKFLLEKTRALDLRLVEPFVRYRQSFYAHRTMETAQTLETLTRLGQAGQLRFSLEASPEVLDARLPDPRVFHLAALGPALTEPRRLEQILAHLEQGGTADLGFPRQAAGRAPEKPVRVDLGGYHSWHLNPGSAPEAAPAALSLLRHYGGPNLAVSVCGPVGNPASDYASILACLCDGDQGRPERPFSLSRWLYATRTLPARLLGLADRGHLGPGARADVALFDPPPDTAAGGWAQSLSRCRTLLKAGTVVIEDFELVRPEVPKATYYRRTGAAAGPLLADICQYRSFRPENLWVADELGGVWVELD
jgi:formylmethanofuran dehydrogenase subunit A